MNKSVWIYIIISTAAHGSLLWPQSPQKYPKIAKTVEISTTAPPTAHKRPQARLNPSSGLTEPTLVAGSSGQGPLDSEAPPGLLSPAFLYYTYLQRIKSQVDPEWAAAIRDHLARFKKTNNFKHLPVRGPTEVVLTLAGDGSVLHVRLIKSCGYSPFDEIAISALKGKVFSNPPKELIDKSGLIRIKWSYWIRL